MGMLQDLQAKGLNVDWYHKSKKMAAPAKESTRFAAAQACGRLTLYILKGSTAYTVTSDGKEHLSYKKLKQSYDDPKFFCSHCKGMFGTWDEAQGHIK